MSTSEVAVPHGSVLQRRFDHARVRDVMRHGVITCEPDATLRDVARIMASYRVHAVVVAPRQNGFGIVSAGDVLQLTEADGEQLTAGEIAATEYVSVDPHAPLAEAAQLMREHEVAHVIVTSANGAPIGVISTLDVAATLAWGET